MAVLSAGNFKFSKQGEQTGKGTGRGRGREGEGEGEMSPV